MSNRFSVRSFSVGRAPFPRRVDRKYGIDSISVRDIRVVRQTKEISFKNVVVRRIKICQYFLSFRKRFCFTFRKMTFSSELTLYALVASTSA